ncbi:hypothetical protein SFRURICE_021301 [Spodoptera frugiperda]|nr:hypothetical protein SFRURICE_021301 [Spodoptera frugiperda]
MYDKCIFRSIASPAECQSGCLAFRVASGRVACAAPLQYQKSQESEEVIGGGRGAEWAVAEAGRVAVPAQRRAGCRRARSACRSVGLSTRRLTLTSARTAADNFRTSLTRSDAPLTCKLTLSSLVPAEGVLRAPDCGNSPPNGGDRVGVAIACSEFLDGAEEPEMGSEGGRLCADTWPAPPKERLSARLSDLAESVGERQGRCSFSPAVVVAESPSGSGARGEALDSSSKSHTRAPSLKGSDSESDSSSVSGVSVISRRHTRSTFKRPRTEEGQGLSLSSNTQEAPDPPKIPTAARGRGRGKAKRMTVTARSKPAKRLAAEDALRSGALSDSSIKKISDADGMQGERGTGTLRQTVREALRQVAGKKSQSTKAAQLKSVEAEIMAAAFDVCRVPSAGKVHQELAQMRQELVRLSASNAALETELRSTKAELAACRGSHPQPSAEPDMLGLMRREMTAFQQRFNVLESRLLRPSLATSSSATSRSYAAVAARCSTSSGQTGCGAQPVARPRAAPPTRTPAPPAVPAPATLAANASSGRKRRKRGAAAQQAEAPATGEPTPPARGLDGNEWQVVGEARRVAKERESR